jgi:Putative zinc-finger
MTTMHEEWSDKLSEYLDGELSRDDRAAVEAHLSECAACSAVLADLKRVVERAQALQPRPPQADLWRGISARIDAGGTTRAEALGAAAVVQFQRQAPPGGSASSRRISFTLPQLAAAAVVLMAVSGAAVWQIAERSAKASPSNVSLQQPMEREASAEPADADAARGSNSNADGARGFSRATDRDASIDDVQLAAVAAADPQYDAAVAELESALKKGRGRLDAGTIAIVEHNLQIIDQVIDQARQALAADPANSYLSSHLFEARRRKLDLLRRAAVLSAESD